MQGSCSHGRGTVSRCGNCDTVSATVEGQRDMGKIRVGIIFGGRSGEHEISLRSARCIVDAIDRDRFSVTLLGIDRGGRWHLLDEPGFRQLTAAVLPALNGAGHEIMLLPAPGAPQIIEPERPSISIGRLDVLFPVLHGTY